MSTCRGTLTMPCSARSQESNEEAAERAVLEHNNIVASLPCLASFRRSDAPHALIKRRLAARGSKRSPFRYSTLRRSIGWGSVLDPLEIRKSGAFGLGIPCRVVSISGIHWRPALLGAR